MKRKLIIIVLVFTMIFSGCNSGNQIIIRTGKAELKIVRQPGPDVLNTSKMELMGKYNPNLNDPFQIDFRSRDISETDLQKKMGSIAYSAYDTQTKWPDKLPDSFSPEAVMEMGKNPGLNIRKLHDQHINGKGIGIAIIDQTLLVEHEEYKDRLKDYEEIHNLYENATMHGPGVASIAVGKTLGVAPEADLYYIANTYSERNDIVNVELDYSWIAKCIDRIIEINKGLSAGRKIRAISISRGWNEGEKGYMDVEAAVKRAYRDNIFVMYTSMGSTQHKYFSGLGRDIYKDPNFTNSYEVSISERNSFMALQKTNKFLAFLQGKIHETLYVPMDSRTYASAIGDDDYTFSRIGGKSWCVPYIAGLYALCCQVNPDITPDKFWSQALKTGDIINVNYENKYYKFGKIVNPERLIKSIKK